MMMTSQESRQSVMDSLSALITNGKDEIADLLNKLQWSKDNVMAGTRMMPCPVNFHHSVPEETLASHVKECQLVQDGYSRQEQKEIRHFGWFYANAKSVVSVAVDQQTQNTVLSRVSGHSGLKPVPQTSRRYEKEFNSDEKLALYESVIETAKMAGQGSNIPVEDLALDPNLVNQTDKTKADTRDAVIAKERDLKRRRQTYRAKNVHITQRSQIQIMKEIIDSQMTELEDIAKEERKKQRREKRKGQSEDETRDETRDENDGSEKRQQDRRDRRREYGRDKRKDERRRNSDEFGDERASSFYNRVRVKVEEQEEGEVQETYDSRTRSRRPSCDRNPTDKNESLRRERERSPAPMESSENKRYDHDENLSRHSREDSIDSTLHSRHSSQEKLMETSANRDKRERRHKKHKSDREHKSRHKHKRSRHKNRIKEEKI